MREGFSQILRGLLAGLALSAALGAAPAAAQGVKIAVIDVRRLVTDSVAGKEALAKLRQIQEQKVAEAKAKQDEIDQLRKRLNEGRLSLADDKREQLQKQYNEKSIDYKSFTEKASRDLDQAQKKELADLERRVFPIISQLGKERGFTLIFNKFQSGLVFADDAADITEDVLKRFNTQVAVPPPAAAAKAPAPAAAAPAPAPTKKPS